MGTVQESFAYILSGEKIKKREYLDWENDFAFSLEKFIEFVALNNIGTEGEKNLTEQFFSQQKKYHYMQK